MGSACRRALRGHARRAYFGESMFTVPAMPQKWRWCIWWRGSRPAAFGCSNTQFVTDHLAVSVPSRCRGGSITKLLEAALIGESDFLGRCRTACTALRSRAEPQRADLT